VDPISQLGPKVAASILTQADPSLLTTLPVEQDEHTPSPEYTTQSVMEVPDVAQVLLSKYLPETQDKQVSAPDEPEVTAHPSILEVAHAPAFKILSGGQVAQLSLSAQVKQSVATLATQAPASRMKVELHAEQTPSPEYAAHSGTAV
jgi:hypothetical protein